MIRRPNDSRQGGTVDLGRPNLPEEQHAAAPGSRGRHLVAALLVAAGAATGAGFLAVATARAIAPRWAADLQQLAPVVIAVVDAGVIAALVLVMGRTRADREDLLALRRTDGRAVGSGVAVWAGAYLAAGVFYLAVGQVGGSGLRDAVDLLMSVGADNGRLHTAGPLLVAVVVLRIVVLSPVAEELLFRGALFGWLRTHLSARWTILLTAVAFGLMHQSPTFIPLAVLVGVGAGWVRERTGSVLVPMAAHALQSSVVVVLSLLVTGWDTPALLG